MYIKLIIFYSISQLSCGHVFHLRCCKRVLENRWYGPRITFGFSQCPICKVRLLRYRLYTLYIYILFSYKYDEE